MSRLSYTTLKSRAIELNALAQQKTSAYRELLDIRPEQPGYDYLEHASQRAGTQPQGAAAQQELKAYLESIFPNLKEAYSTSEAQTLKGELKALKLEADTLLSDYDISDSDWLTTIFGIGTTASAFAGAAAFISVFFGATDFVFLQLAGIIGGAVSGGFTGAVAGKYIFSGLADAIGSFVSKDNGMTTTENAKLHRLLTEVSETCGETVAHTAVIYEALE